VKLTGKKTGPDEAPARRRQNSEESARPSAVDLSQRYAFRRNRTLTGSSSAQIASSNELNAELRSPRAHVHHLTSLRRRLLASFVAVAFVAFGLYLLLSQLVASATIQMAGIGVLSNDDQAVYHKTLDAYYAARPAERLRFLLDDKALLSHIQASRPEVQSIHVEPGQNIGEAAVTIVSRKPIARWNLDGNNQYVDGEGVVFARNYYGDPGLQIIDNSGIQASSSRLVASNRFLGFVGRVIAKSSASGLSVQTVMIPSLTTRQIVLTLKGKTTQYKLSVDRSAGQQVEDIVHVDRYLTAKNAVPGYVDVRIAGKAFYK
jgi:hypothetical protein